MYTQDARRLWTIQKSSFVLLITYISPILLKVFQTFLTAPHTTQKSFFDLLVDAQRVDPSNKKPIQYLYLRFDRQRELVKIPFQGTFKFTNTARTPSASTVWAIMTIMMTSMMLIMSFPPPPHAWVSCPQGWGRIDCKNTNRCHCKHAAEPSEKSEGSAQPTAHVHLCEICQLLRKHLPV